MRKPFTKIMLLIISLLLVFSITACTEDDPTEKAAYIVSISVDTSTIPTNAVAGNVDLSEIKLIVLMSDDTVLTVDVTDNMVFTSDRNKLLRLGTHHISLIYGGMSTRFSLTLGEAAVVKYKLIVEGGAMLGRQPVDGIWSGDIDADQRVTIVAIDKSSEGKYFSSWQISNQVYNRNSSCEITVNRNITIVAFYEQITFRVNFDSDGGSNVAQTEGSAIEQLPITTRPEYVFVRWVESDTGSPVTFPYSIKRNITLKAEWEPLGLIYQKEPSALGYTIIGYNYTGTRTSLTIPDSHGDFPILKIARDAFSGATTLKHIRLSRYITDIEDYAFSECINLLSFDKDPLNTSFGVTNGVLFDQDTLVAYPAGRMRASYDVVLVSRIGNGAFYNANIGSININSTLLDIGDYAFNSRTIDNVIFSMNVPQQMEYRESIFNNNINNIFIVQKSFLSSYQQHPAFSPYANKINELENTTPISVFNNFLYKVISRDIDGIESSTIEIIGVDRSLTSITLPIIKIEGKDITSIGSYAFSYSYNLQDIIITQQSKLDRILEGAFDNTKWQNQPNHNNIVNGLIIINDKLFRCLEDRKEYTIPFTVTKIAEASFSNLQKLEKVVFELNPLGNRHITTIDAFAFKNCTNLNEIIIPKTVNKIGANAFENTKLGSFSIENNSVLKKIEAFSFLNARHLKSISLGNDVEDIGSGAFNGCYSLEKILIKDGENSDFITKDGVLYEKNKETDGNIDNFGRILHTYPAARIQDVYVIPSGVTHIKEYAFYYSNVAAIILPSTIESIVFNSFVVPQLVYIEFTAEIKIATYATLFSTYHPSHIFISESDSVQYGTFGAPSEMIKKRSSVSGIDQLVGTTENIEGQKFIYRNDDAGIYIIGAERGETFIKVPSSIEISEGNTHNVVGIGSYAFIGDLMREVELPSTIQTIKSYAFYYSSALKRIISNRNSAPTLEYEDINVKSTVISFNPNTIIDSALVFVPEGAIQDYINKWPSTADFIIVIGSQPQIIFDSNEGSDATLLDLVSGEPIDLSVLDIIERSPVTERLGYVFAGWFESQAFDGEAVSFPYTKYKNVILFAKWNVRTFVVTFDAAGGDLVSAQTTVNYGEFYTFEVPVKAGYAFQGWFDLQENKYTDMNGTAFGIGYWVEIKNVELIAKWAPQEFFITYDTTGGEMVTSNIKVFYNQSYTLDLPTRQGYVFKGWKDAQDVFIAFINGNSIKPWSYTSDITIYASWEALSYTVRFNAGENGTQFANQIVVYGQHFTFPVPTDENSVFFGWYDGSGGTGKQYTNQLGQSVRTWDKVGTNIFMYAQWPKNISNQEDFNSIRANPEGSYILTNDIEFTGDWLPLGVELEVEGVQGELLKPFTGIFDGNGYSITNMTITKDNTGYIGFIAHNKGIIRNLNLGIRYIDNVPDTTERAIINVMSSLANYTHLYVGGIVGYNDTMGIIHNCKIAVEINAETNQNGRNIYVGGIAGYNNGKITNTYVITEIDASIAEGILQGDIYEGSLTGYHKLGGEISSCHYDRIVSSPDTQTKACGNESIPTDFGLYTDTIGSTTQSGW